MSLGPITEPLNEAQRAAVEHGEGPLLILAGPGSGKTRVVTHRVAHLLEQGVPGSQILALTFTNKAANEMKSRLQRLCGGRAPGADRVWMGTFHSFGARLLRQYADLAGLGENYTILDVDDSRRTLLRAIERAEADLAYCTPARLQNAISSVKGRVVTPEQYEPPGGDPAGQLVQQVYPVYQRLLREANAVDFDDLLLLPACLLRDNAELRRRLDERYRHILVDEYQDTNVAQYAIVRALSNDYPNLAVTGDPDQSIYSWRGATINNILTFEQDYGQVATVRLERNYRSTPAILRVADSLISHNRQRKPKRLLPACPEGPAVRLTSYPTHRDEAAEIAARIAGDIASGRRAAGDIAVFYRVNSLSRSVEQALREQGVPYQIVHGVEFYQRKEVKDALAYLQLLNNPRNDIALLRIINTPPRGIGAKTQQRLAQHAARHGKPILEAAREAALIPELNKRAAVHVARFVALIDSLQLVFPGPVEGLLGRVLSDSGYLEHLESSQQEEDQQRLSNLQELLNAAREFDELHGDEGLEPFLDQASLVSDIDDWDSEGGRVTLMTLHASKGLEFDCVYIIGVEEGLLPHERCRDDPLQLEEERRLLFVGITRARRQLQLSHALNRASRGGLWPAVASQFLVQLPREEMELLRPPGSYHWQESDWQAPGESQELDESFDIAELESEPAGTAGLGEFDSDPHPADEQDEQHDELHDSGRDSPAARPAAADSSWGSLMTAAQMLPSSESAGEPVRPSPEIFRHGMLVQDPEYGPGKIVALSGSGDKRTATVQFLRDASLHSFRLAFSDLHPIGSSPEPRG